MAVKWEELDQLDGYGELHRAKVPGGWIVRQLVDYKVKNQEEDINDFSISITFYPDPKHEWNGSSA